MNKNNTMSLCVGCHDVADRWDLQIIPKFKKRRDTKAGVKTLKCVAMNE